MPIELRPYQLEAVNKFEPVPNAGCFDDMGLGKTVIGVALDRVRRDANSGKTLVVAPAGTKIQDWERHFHLMEPDLKVVTLDPKARYKSWKLFIDSNADVFIVHWQALDLMQTELTSFAWLHVIADEVHKIKNRDTKMAKALKKIPTYYKIGLSGTPSTGKPDDLWSILNWLYPNTWRSFHAYRNSYCEMERPWVKDPKTGKPVQANFKVCVGPMNEVELQNRISMYTIRRLATKELTGVEDKNPVEYFIDMYPIQKQAYDQMTEDMVAWVHTKMAETGAKDEDDLHPMIANAVVARLIRQQQFACAYATIDPTTNEVRLSEPSSKLDAAWDIMQERLDNKQPVVIFSFFKQMIDLYKIRLAKAGLHYAEITGDIPQSQRFAQKEAFQNGEVDIFLGTIAAGGEGIDLFRSRTVMFLSRDWNPALNQQAEGRLHRIGQTGIVDVIDFYVNGTVEFYKKDRVHMKWGWVKTLLGDADASQWGPPTNAPLG